MKISTILDHIDSGHMALPEFQRGYVWNRDQVRGLFDSLYRRHPIGGLLVWATESKSAAYRGDEPLATGIVKLLLDGQQRITSIYGVVRGRPPKFFDGNSQAFTGLRFHLETESFAFYQPIKMKEDPLWIDVTELMKTGLKEAINRLNTQSSLTPKFGDYVSRLTSLHSVTEINLHLEELTGPDKSLNVVVDIFNRVNSGGTKLSKGDLTLAKIAVDWTEVRDFMKAEVKRWAKADYHFNLDWLLRSVNTVLTGEAQFKFLHDKNAEEIKDGLKRAIKYIDQSLNQISGRLGLDHDRVFFGRFGIPVMVRYLDKRKGQLDEKEWGKLLFWFAQSGMWGRFSGSTESFIDLDLKALEGPTGNLDKLLETLRLWHGFKLEDGHFTGWSMGARFYPVLYMLTRMGSSRDWGTGLDLKSHMLGRMNKLEVHHIFPKAQLRKLKIKTSEVNALANFCFQTKETNLKIKDRLPEEYFLEIERSFPGALTSHWIPMDHSLWKIERFQDFLAERRKLLAAEFNNLMENLLHGDTRWLEGPSAEIPSEIREDVTGEEDAQLEVLNDWMEKKNLPRGVMAYDIVDPAFEKQGLEFDLSWPNGIQEELSQPVVLILNKNAEDIANASQAGYQCFTSIDGFKRYIQTKILSEDFSE